MAADLGVPIPIAQILVNRKITDAEEAHRFLRGSLDDLHDPYLMQGMRDAVSRLRKAVSRGEIILIFGDYDVDGVLSVVILKKALESLGARVEYFIPDRIKHGYGLKEKHIRVVQEKKASLVVSVDCGVKALDFVKKSGEIGVDVIITDHHQPGPTLPQAAAVLNPVLEDSGYPDKSLAGVGVVFKLIQALLEEEGKKAAIPHYLKLVSIATVADIAPLKKENRIFVKHGLNGLKRVSNKGLTSLLEVCGLSGKSVNIGDVGFRIGPRINAAGRMGKAELAVDLFFSDSEEECRKLTAYLNERNAERQAVEKRILSQALAIITSRSLESRYKLLILGCEEWHRGVIGIVSSKLKDQFYRPVILFSYQDGRAFGSGRSIKEFPLIDCLDKNKQFFLNYGGHPMAAGCEVERSNLTNLKEAINRYAHSYIKDEDMKRKIRIDTRLSFQDIDVSFLDNLSKLSPFGVGNPRPVFLSENVELTAEPRKIKDRHSKMLVGQNGRNFELLGWGKPDLSDIFHKGDRIDLVYSLQFSEFLGEERLNFSLEDIRPHIP